MSDKLEKIDNLANKQKLFRRIILIWAICLITYTGIIVMDHEFLIAVSSAGASVIISIVGILTTVIGFYQWHRNKDDENKT